MPKQLKDLIPNPRNPRKITDEKLKMLDKSLAEFGDLSGFVFNIKSSHLVGGHQRGKVLPPDAEIHCTPCERTETGTVGTGHVLINGEKFNYREVDWDEKTEKAAMIAANKHGGQWDYSLLPDLLLELDHENLDMELTGFDEKELEEMMTHSGSGGSEAGTDGATLSDRFLVPPFSVLDARQGY